jgi:hypothetical protein
VKARDVTIEQRFCPPHRPLVLDGEAKLRPTISLGMKIQTTILRKHLAFSSLNLLGLVVKFVSLRKRITLGYALETANNPEKFRELCYGIGHQLMQLHLELEQDIS